MDSQGIPDSGLFQKWGCILKARNWKRFQPKSLPEAMEGCLDYARERHNRSVDHVAELMCLPSKWNLYKWVEGGTMPMVRLRAFENACRCDFVSRWYAHSAGKLLVGIPAGKTATSTDINELQGLLNTAVGELIQFAACKADASSTLEAIRAAMEALAWHHGNVEKYSQPELEFGGNQE